MKILKMKVEFTNKVDEVKSDTSTLSVFWSSVKMLIESVQTGQKYLLKLFVITKEADIDGEKKRKIHDVFNHGLFLQDFAYEYRISHLREDLDIPRQYVEEHIEELFVEATESVDTENVEVKVEDKVEEQTNVTVIPPTPRTKRHRRTKAEMEAYRKSLVEEKTADKVDNVADKTETISNTEEKNVSVDATATTTPAFKGEEIPFTNLIIDKFIYNEDEQLLKVNYHTGKSITLKGVPKEVVDNARVADNISLYYNTTIRGQYETV